MMYSLLKQLRKNSAAKFVVEVKARSGGENGGSRCILTIWQVVDKTSSQFLWYWETPLLINLIYVFKRWSNLVRPFFFHSMMRNWCRRDIGELVDLQVLFRVKWLQTQEKLNEKIIYHFPALIVMRNGRILLALELKRALDHFVN
jgi:hypothetical protein